MIFKAYYLGCLAHASYLIGDEATKTAVIVDPQRDIEQYTNDARSLGLTIRHVILTHFHADFVAGHLELSESTGARIHLGARAKAEYAFDALKDGASIEFGGVKLVALETPGHTPEGITILVYDLAKDATKPTAALTGDTLFVGDVGRPDLMASAGFSADDLAGAMYDTIHTKLETLPDDVEVWPAHGAGSMCGKQLSNERFSTIGAQKASNWAFRAMPKAEFVREATRDLPMQPAYFGFAAELNRKRRPTLTASLKRALEPVSLDEIVRAMNAGAIVLDAREPDDFTRGHLAGSVNVGLSGKYATWAGTLLDRTKPIYLIAAPGKETEAAVRLGRIGFDQVKGFLAEGAAAITSRPDLVRSFQRWTPEELARQLAAPNPPHVLDVRAETEWREKRIHGAQLVPLPELERRIAEVPKDRRVVIHCAGGYRSSIAASLLLKHGRTNVEDLIGGMGAWEKAHQPVAR
jgi:hydroxyacylglutathione hydrolase